MGKSTLTGMEAAPSCPFTPASALDLNADFCRCPPMGNGAFPAVVILGEARPGEPLPGVVEMQSFQASRPTVPDADGWVDYRISVRLRVKGYKKARKGGRHAKS